MRKGLLASVICCAAALWAVPTALADSVTIGSVAPSSTGGCNTCTFMQFTTDPSSPSYVVPPAPATGPWMITSWSARGGIADGAASLEIWRPTNLAQQFQLVTIAAEQTFPANVVTSHAVSIPVLPGDHLALRTGADGSVAPNYVTGSSSDVNYGAVGVPITGQTMGPSMSDFVPNQIPNRRVNAEATLTAPSAAAPISTTPSKKKCKKKKRSAESAKKKKCKKHKKK